ncbi:MAG: DHH family phosphoesterase [Thermoplasmatales archaeon]|nr:DHH family phosphoesterase [Thermoplasmatales archaeon]
MGIKNKAKEISKLIEKQDMITILSHNDADGVAGAAIASNALEERGIKNEVKFVNYLDEKVIEENKDNFVWFIDLGNGSIEEIKEKNISCVISDHHFSKKFHENSINPFFYGIDGEVEISAAGLSYLISSNFFSCTSDLAIVGAIGDLQDLKYCRIVGMNRELLASSRVEIKKDIRIYGREKPLYKMLAYASDPFIPGLFKRIGSSISFLKKIGINHEKSWNELSREEKKILLSSLIKLLISQGFTYEQISRIFGEVYEIDGKDLRDITTILNAMARNGEANFAVDICMKRNYEKCDEILEKYRRNLYKCISFAKNKIEEYGKLLYFHGDGHINENLIGTVTGLLLKEEEIKSPLIGFAATNDGIKVSARLPLILAKKINLSEAIQKVAISLGGRGGGHCSAAGAIIPKGRENDFLYAFEIEIRNQLAL